MRFPAIRLLRGLVHREETPARTPLWLILMRLLLASLLILALAGPILRPSCAAAGAQGPEVIVVDTGWAAANNWASIKTALLAEIDRDQRADMSVVLVPTARNATGNPVDALGPMPAAEARRTAETRLRAAEEPLLNLTPLKEQTYRLAIVDAGLAFRAIINATPFLLPLMFQVGWGLNPAQAGALLLIYFLGNIGIKPATTPILRRFGFRTVLIGNGVLIGVSLLVCAALTPTMPKALLAPLLFLAGAVRSTQFTALNTMSYSEISPRDKASASTLSNMMQQTSLAIGVAGAALLLQAAKTWRGDAVSGIGDFRVAFVALGALGVLAALRFRALKPDAGAEVSGHGRKVASKAFT